jgi:type IV secretion system protein VirB6
MAVCAPFEPLGPYVGNVLAWVDCQALGLGEEGYRALGPGSAFGMALTGLLTIYVALIGYRLLMGGEVTVREGLTTALKIGFVLALATQWPAWRVLVYDVATKTPEAAASGFLNTAGLNSGGSGMLAARLDGVNGALAQLVEDAASVRAATPPVAANAQPGAAPPPAQLPRPAKAVLSETASGSVTSAMGAMVASALAGLLAVRVVMGILLALGPVFIACLLFEGTRGLFVGWLRVLGGAMLGAMAVPAVLALQMAIVEPQVLALRDLLDASRPVAALPQQILGTAAVFALIVLAVLAAMARVGLGFVWPKNRVLDLGRFALPERPLALPAPDWARAGGEERSRAQRVADAASAQGWREERALVTAGPPQRLALPHPASGANDGGGSGVVAPIPLGQSGRRTLQRQSAGARRRDELT